MINSKIMYDIFYYNGSTYSNLSNSLADFYRDTSAITLNKDTDYLYIGYYKPFGYIYFEITTANTNANSFTAEYYNGSAWVAIPSFIDNTKGFTRSGFMQYSKDIETWQTTTINSLNKYYIRLRPSVTHSSTVILGAGVVFSDDVELQAKYFNISDFKGTRASFINEHVQARDYIIQHYRSKGLIKNDYENVPLLNTLSNLSQGKILLTAIDLHDYEEVKLAATYLALSMIFRNASDTPEGNLIAKADYYEKEAKKLLDTTPISYDLNDDGRTGEEEKVNSVTMIRMHK